MPIQSRQTRRPLALLLSFSILLTSFTPPPLFAQDRRDAPFMPAGYTNAAMEGQSFAPSRLENASDSQSAFVAYQNARLQKGHALDSEVLDEILRQNTMDKFLMQETVSVESQKRRGRLISALKSKGLRYKTNPDGKRVWFKDGRTQRIEREAVNGSSGRSFRDTVEMKYDERGNLIAYKTLTYDDRGKKGQTLWNGRYTAGPSGRDVVSESTESRWDALGNETRVNRKNISYDGLGRASGYDETSIDRAGNQARREVQNIEYSAEGLITGYKENAITADGVRSEKDWGQARYERVAGEEMLVSYRETVRNVDEKGVTIAGSSVSIDWSGATYDSRGRLLSYTEETSRESGKVDRRRWEKAQYDVDGNLVGYEENFGDTKRVWKDAKYDSVGRLLSYSESRSTSGSTVFRLWEGAEYNLNNELVQSKETLWDASGRKTSSVWRGAYERARVKSYRETRTDDLNRSTVREWTGKYQASGRLSGFVETAADPSGTATKRIQQDLAYDGAGRLVSYDEKTEDSFGNETTRSWRAEAFDADGRVNAYREKEIAAGVEIDRSRRAIVYTEDGVNVSSFEERVVQGGQSTSRSWRNGVYDKSGRITRYREEVVDPAGNVSVVEWRGAEYDTFGRLVSYRQDKTDANGDRATVTWRAESFDDRDRVIAYREATQSQYGEKVKEWAGSYDGRGLLTASREKHKDYYGSFVTKGMSDVRYDSHGRLTDSRQTVEYSDSRGLTTTIVVSGRTYSSNGDITGGVEKTIIQTASDGRQGNYIVARQIQNAVMKDGRLQSFQETVTTHPSGDSGPVIIEETNVGLGENGDRTEATRRIGYAAIPEESSSVVFEQSTAKKLSNIVKDLAGRTVSFDEETSDVVSPDNKVMRHVVQSYGNEGEMIGYVEQVRELSGSRVDRKVSNMVYDVAGRLKESVEVVSRPGQTTSLETIRKSAMSYDSAGRLISIVETASVEGSGLKQERSCLRRLEYNDFGWVVRSNETGERDGTAYSSEIETLAFDSAGRMSRSVERTKSSDGENHQLERSGFVYDSFGRSIAFQEHGRFNGSYRERHWQAVSFDDLGRERASSETGFSENGAYRTKSDVLAYDDLGRVSARRMAGWSAAEGDYETLQSSLKYDLAGRQSSYEQTKRIAGEETTLQWASLGYDSQGRARGHTEKGKVTEFSDSTSVERKPVGFHSYETAWTASSYNDSGQILGYDQSNSKTFADGRQETQNLRWSHAAYDPEGRLSAFLETKTTSLTDNGISKTSTASRLRENITYYEERLRSIVDSSPADKPGTVERYGLLSGFTETVLDDSSEKAFRIVVGETRYDSFGRQTGSETTTTDLSLTEAKNVVDDHKTETTSSWLRKLLDVGINVVQWIREKLASPETSPSNVTRRLNTRYDNAGRETSWDEITTSAAMPEKITRSHVSVAYEGESRRLQSYDARTHDCIDVDCHDDPSGSQSQHLYKDRFVYDSSNRAVSFRETTFEGDNLVLSPIVLQSAPPLSGTLDWRSLSDDQRQETLNNILENRQEVLGQIQFQLYEQIEYDASGNMNDALGARVVRGYVLADFAEATLFPKSVPELKEAAEKKLLEEAEEEIAAAYSPVEAYESEVRIAQDEVNALQTLYDESVRIHNKFEATVAGYERSIQEQEALIQRYDASIESFRGKDVFYSGRIGSNGRGHFTRFRIGDDGALYRESGDITTEYEDRNGNKVAVGVKSEVKQRDMVASKGDDERVSGILAWTQMAYTDYTNPLAAQVRGRHLAKMKRSEVQGSLDGAIVNRDAQRDIVSGKRGLLDEARSRLKVATQKLGAARETFNADSADIRKHQREKLSQSYAEIEAAAGILARNLQDADVVSNGKTHRLTETQVMSLLNGESVSILGGQFNLGDLGRSAQVKRSLNSEERFADLNMRSAQGAQLAWRGQLELNGKTILSGATSALGSLKSAIARFTEKDGSRPGGKLNPGFGLASDGSLTISRTTAKTNDVAGRLTSQSVEVAELTRQAGESSWKSFTQETDDFRYDQKGRTIGYRRTTREEDTVGGQPEITTETLLSASYDVQGRLFQSQTRHASGDGSSLSDGNRPQTEYLLTVTNESFDQSGRAVRSTRVREEDGRVFVENNFADTRFDVRGRVIFSGTESVETSADAWSIAEGDISRVRAEKTRTTVWNHSFDRSNNVISLTRLTQNGSLHSDPGTSFHSIIENLTQSFDSQGRLAQSSSDVHELGIGSVAGFLNKSYRTETEIMKFGESNQVLRQKRTTWENSGSTVEEDIVDRIYDEQDRLTATKTRLTDALGEVTEVAWKVLKLDDTGHVLRFERTTSSNPSKTGESVTNLETSLSDASYDSEGRLVRQETRMEEIASDGTISKSSDQILSVLKYDRFGRVVESENTTVLHRGPAPDQTTIEKRAISYDIAGRVRRTETQGKDEWGEPYVMTQLVLAFDEQGRAQRVKETTVKNGVLTERTSLGDITYDHQDRIVASRDVVRQRGNGLDKVFEESLSDVRYDTSGRRSAYTRVTKDGSSRTEEKAFDIAYDESDRIISITTESVESSLDPNISLSRSVTTRQSSMQYDARGNLINYEKTIVDGAVSTTYKPVLFEYDEKGRTSSILEYIQDNIGRSQISGSLDIRYNGLGQVTSARNVTVDYAASSVGKGESLNILKDLIVTGAFQRTGAGQLAKKLGIEHVVVESVLENRYDLRGRLVSSRSITDDAAWDREGKDKGTLTFDTRAEAENLRRRLEKDGYTVGMSVERVVVHMSEERSGHRGHNEWDEVVDGKAILTYSREVAEKHGVETLTQTLAFDSLNRAVLQSVSTKDGTMRTAETRLLTYNPAGQMIGVTRYVNETGLNGDGTSYSKSFAQEQTLSYDSLNRVSAESYRTYHDASAPLRETVVLNDNIHYGETGRRINWTETSWSNAEPAKATIKQVANATYNAMGQLVGAAEDVYEAGVSITGIGSPSPITQHLSPVAEGNKHLLYSDKNIHHTYDSRGRLMSTTSNHTWGSPSMGEGGTFGSGSIQGLDDSWTSGQAQVSTVYSYNTDSSSLSGMKVTAHGTGTHANKAVEAQGIHLSNEQKNIQYNVHGQVTGYTKRTTQVEYYDYKKEVQKGVRKKITGGSRVEAVTTETVVSGLEYDHFGRQTHSVSVGQRNDYNQTWSRTETTVRSFDEQGRAKDVDRVTDSRSNLPKKRGSFVARVGTGMILCTLVLGPGLGMIAAPTLAATSGNLVGGKAVVTHSVIAQSMAYKADGSVDDSLTKTNVIEQSSKVKGKNWGDKVLQTQDIAVAVGAAVGTAATGGLAAVGVAVLSATYNTARQGISTHDLAIAGRERDREGAKQRAYSFYSQLGSVALSGFCDAAQTGKFGIPMQLTMATPGGYALFNAIMQMAIAEASGADRRTVYQSGVLALVSGSLSGAGGSGGPASATRLVLTAVGEITIQVGGNADVTKSSKIRNFLIIAGSAMKGASSDEDGQFSSGQLAQSAIQRLALNEIQRMAVSEKPDNETSALRRTIIDGQTAALVGSGIQSMIAGFKLGWSISTEKGASRLAEAAVYSVKVPVSTVWKGAFDAKSFLFGGISTLASGDIVDVQPLTEEGNFPFDEDPSKVAAMSINGMDNLEMDAIAMNNSLKQALCLKKATLIANYTHANVIGDGLQSFFYETFGTYDKSAINAASAMKEAIRKKGSVYVIAHSQGTAIFVMAIRLLTRQERAKVHYYGAGSEWFVNAERFGLASARNVWNDGDKIPKWANNLNPANWLNPMRWYRIGQSREKGGEGRTSWARITVSSDGKETSNHHNFRDYYKEDMNLWAQSMLAQKMYRTVER